MPVAKRPTSRITAGFARDLGREVFAVQGRIDAPASVGCNELIVEGARLLVRLAEAVLERGSRERGHPSFSGTCRVALYVSENWRHEQGWTFPT
jgi:predicted Rossmann fold nucleotide-binding protein DprA/Smf involved in DNA uptake